ASGGVIVVVSGATTKLRAFRSNLAPSPVASAVYGLRVGTLTITPPEGIITNGTVISISTITPGAVIYYDFDFGFLTTNAPVYSGPFAITWPLPLKGGDPAE